MDETSLGTCISSLR